MTTFTFWNWAPRSWKPERITDFLNYALSALSFDARLMPAFGATSDGIEAVKRASLPDVSMVWFFADFPRTYHDGRCWPTPLKLIC